MKKKHIASAVVAVALFATLTSFITEGDKTSALNKQTSEVSKTNNDGKVMVNLSPEQAEKCQKEEKSLSLQKETNEKASLELARLSVVMSELFNKIKTNKATQAEINSYNKSIPTFDKMNKDNNNILAKFNDSATKHNKTCGITIKKDK